MAALEHRSVPCVDPVMRSSLLPRLVPLATLIVACCATVVAIAVWALVPSNADCGLPPGTAQLAPAAQADIVRHVLACRDLEHGRITREEYRKLLGTEPKPAPAPQIVWAASVLGVSSEYSATSWSAQQVLGPPDVYPATGDNPHAWASLEADAVTEYIEVGFAQPVVMCELQIYETLNPGAISSVETISVSGHRAKHAMRGNKPGTFVAPVGAQISHVPLAGGEAIAAVRVTLASGIFPGWNEIDAIGGVPCAEQ
jgi:hypothetical protein